MSQTIQGYIWSEEFTGGCFIIVDYDCWAIPVRAKKTPATLVSEVKNSFDKSTRTFKKVSLRESQKWVATKKASIKVFINNKYKASNANINNYYKAKPKYVIIITTNKAEINRPQSKVILTIENGAT